MRLIDADAFYKKIEEIRMEYLEEDTLSSKFAAEIIETVMDSYLQDAPTIEAEPVKRGKWVKDESRDMLRCSVCKNFCVENWYYWLRYCPDCGARMDGE